MGLKKFDYKIKDNNKKPIIIVLVIIMILLIGVTVYMTQAKYKVTNSYNILKGKIAEFPTFPEGTLAYNILTNYGVVNIETISTELTPLNPDDINITEQWFSDTDTYWYGTDYSYDSNTKQFTLSGTKIQATYAECRNGQKSDGTAIECSYTLKRNEENAQATYVYQMIDTSSNVVKTKVIALGNKFTIGTKENEAGIFEAPDDYGTSYYFRGNPTNNYVTLGPNTRYKGCFSENPASCTTTIYFNTEADCLNEFNFCTLAEINNLWKIIRINGDGTIRMIYSESIGEGNYNNSSYRTHVGYMFGTGTDPYTNTNNSAVKSFLDNWYINTLKQDFEEYIADSIFCNDREINEIKTNETVYMAQVRLKEYAPKLTCTQQNDRFTVNDTVKGNGALTNPIGLLTADEYMMAGGSGYANSLNFLKDISDSYWTMTPYSKSGDNAIVFKSAFGQYPYVTQSGVYPDYRPVINLKADVAFSGTGTIDDPYVITTN